MRGLERFAPLTGVVFVLLVIVATVIVGETPMADDSLAKAVSYFDDNKDEVIVGSIIAAISTVFMLWFGGVWRAALAAAEGPPARLANTAFGGLIVAAVGWAALIAFTFVAADTVGDVAPVATQTLSALQADFFFPVAIGFSVFLLASGLAMVRGVTFRSWPGWVALVLGVLAVTPAGFFAILGGLAWIVGISVMLFVRGEGPVVPGPRAAEPMPPPD
jgi:hypothetical protein